MIVILLAVCGLSEVASGPEPGDSQCVRCHTDVKGLIRLSWEVTASRPAPVQSVETSGEG